jgi:hypothetical protein
MRLVFSAEKGYSRGGALGVVGGRNPGGRYVIINLHQHLPATCPAAATCSIRRQEGLGLAGFLAAVSWSLKIVV